MCPSWGLHSAYRALEFLARLGTQFGGLLLGFVVGVCCWGLLLLLLGVVVVVGVFCCCLGFLLLFGVVVVVVPRLGKWGTVLRSAVGPSPTVICSSFKAFPDR